MLIKNIKPKQQNDEYSSYGHNKQEDVQAYDTQDKDGYECQDEDNENEASDIEAELANVRKDISCEVLNNYTTLPYIGTYNREIFHPWNQFNISI